MEGGKGVDGGARGGDGASNDVGPAEGGLIAGGIIRPSPSPSVMPVFGDSLSGGGAAGTSSANNG